MPHPLENEETGDPERSKQNKTIPAAPFFEDMNLSVILDGSSSCGFPEITGLARKKDVVGFRTPSVPRKNDNQPDDTKTDRRECKRR